MIIIFNYFTVHFYLTETTTNSIVMFFVGAAVTLALVLAILLLIWFCKRRRQAPKLSTGVLEVNTIEMQNELTPESSSNNQVYIYWNIV